MRALVTGAAGFIGSAFVRNALLNSGSEPSELDITAFDALSYAGNLENLAPVADRPEFTFVRGDITDADHLAAVLPGHDAVVNFAAETHVDRSIEGPSVFVRTNVLGTQTLLDAALRAGVKRFVQVSTDEVYGSIDEGSWTESSPLDPNSPYAASKAAADHLALAYERTYGMNVSVTRCSNNYGPHQYPEKVIPYFVTLLMGGHRIPLYGDGGNVRDWLHVDDHCAGIRLVLDRGEPGEVYHIGGGVELSNRELTRLLLDEFDCTTDMIEQVPDRPGHDRRYSLDDSKLRALGYRPRVPFREGLRATVNWYRENSSWWKPLLP
ncbi:dTDP-glucose 4,6-dehydratase [Streptomyces sp. NBC_01275]|uniref:dTDP-glucose 4,6-dehydratase n=1 Tax=Streptomyces sp. NBC_01275 TaxID=2903807 RepID=UPI002256CE3F|nr:dTDP-glucose 4,6-dehydratase [Streptomyces sp. NBC_01275]MCX4760225.1 dTDP-glucose 4,6-dehydratase [Streptomyces sp. NBC_01275]